MSAAGARRRQPSRVLIVRTSYNKVTIGPVCGPSGIDDASSGTGPKSADRARCAFDRAERHTRGRTHPQERKSVVTGKGVSVRVDLGGRRIIKKQKAHKKE